METAKDGTTVQLDGTAQELNQSLNGDRDHEDTSLSSRIDEGEKRRARMSRVGGVLRQIGIGVLLASAVALLLQRWDGMAYMGRYFSFLGFTAVVCAGGLLCGLGIKENKGARALLAVVALLIPVHFAQLGAIVYSRCASEIDPGAYPAYFFWSVPSLADALVALGLGVCCLVPMAFIAFGVLARTKSKALVALSFASGFLQVVPTRDPYIISSLAGFMGLVCVYIDRHLIDCAETRTKEGLVARAVPYLGIAMIFSRQFLLYPTPEFVDGVLFAGVSYMFFRVIPQFSRKFAVVFVSELFALVTAIVACILVEDEVLRRGMSMSWHITCPLVGMSVAVVLSLMGARAQETKKVFRSMAAVSMLCVAWVQLFDRSTSDTGIFSLIVGIVAVTWACLMEQRGMLLAGSLLVTVGLTTSVYTAICSVAVSPWLLLGVVGLSTVIGASYLERHYIRFAAAVSSARAKVEGWS